MRAGVVFVFSCLLILSPAAPQDQEEDTPTQIPRPPPDDEKDAVSEDAEKNGYDVNYVVNRPTTDSDDDDAEDICSDEEGDTKCAKEKKDLTPYTKFESYKNWKRRPLFLIIIGGLRWDYLAPGELDPDGSKTAQLRAFNWMKEHGTTMSQVVPVFPPYDMPVWTSMATGLYPDNTGVLGDYMYNLNTSELFNRNDPDSSLKDWWISGEPIWSVAAKHKRKVSVINWHDCTLHGGNLSHHCRPYVPQCPDPAEYGNSCISNKRPTTLFNRAFTRIHKDGYDLSVVYIDVLKKAAKKYGPNSKEVMDELIKLDKVLQARLADIKNKKERADLKLNILLVSDYGLNGVQKTTKVVLDDYLDFDHVQYIFQRGGSTVLVPFALKHGDIMGGVGNKTGVAHMVGINAYIRDVNSEMPPLDYPEIPEDLHYDGQTWTQDILLVAKAGFEIVINCTGEKCPKEKILPPLDQKELGNSGYEPRPDPPYIVPGRDKHKTPELRAREKLEVSLFNKFAHMMKTVGFAWGPDFKTGYTSDPIETVDLYQLMAFLLKIPPNQHDGEWARIRQMLMISSSPSTSIPNLIIFIPLVILTRLVTVV